MDPLYSSLFGGDGFDYIGGIKIAPNGDIVITGHTYSKNLPVTSDAIQLDLKEDFDPKPDIFLAIFDNSGTQLKYLTYLGGLLADYCEGLAIDQSGNIYIGGYTEEAQDFPISEFAFQKIHAGGFDAFVTKLSPDGTEILFSTYVGGKGDDYLTDIEIDPLGRAVFAGYTTIEKDLDLYPVTTDAYQKKHNGIVDAFVTQLNESGDALIYSTLYGGSKEEFSSAVSVAPNGIIYISGATYSEDLPLSAYSLDSTYNDKISDSGDVFVAILDEAATRLIYSSYLGGSGDDFAYDLAIDDSGNFYVTGSTSSTNFPVSVEAFDKNFNDDNPDIGKGDGFVTKFKWNGRKIKYSTYIGSTGTERSFRVVVDDFHEAYITGSTNYIDFPITSDAFQKNFNDEQQESDGFLVRFSPRGDKLRYASYLGGNSPDVGRELEVLHDRTFLAGGITGSDNFPLTQNSFDDIRNDTELLDLYFAQIPSPMIDVFAGEDIDICVGDTVQLSPKYWGGCGKLEYNWSPSTYLSSPDSAYPKSYPDDDVTYILTITDSLGNAINDEITIFVHPQPAPAIQGQLDAFKGSTNEYYTNYTDESTYLWRVLGGTIVDGQGTHKIKVKWGNVDFGSLVVNEKSIGGCSDSSDAVIVTLKDFVKPGIKIEGKLEFCEGDTLVLEADDGYGEYKWSNGDSIRIIKVTESGQYWVIVFNPNGKEVSSDTITVTILPSPEKPRIRFNGGKLRCLTSAASYQWIYDGFDIPGATDRVYTVLASGRYNIRIEGPNGCSSLSDTLLLQLNNIEDDSDRMKLYPVPAHSYVIIENALFDMGSWELFDITGRQLDGGLLKRGINLVNLRKITAGIYSVVIQNELGKKIRKKLLINR